MPPQPSSNWWNRSRLASSGLVVWSILMMWLLLAVISRAYCTHKGHVPRSWIEAEASKDSVPFVWKFLGHVVSKNGVATEPAKTEKVANWPTPMNRKEVNDFGSGKLLPEIYYRFCVRSEATAPTGGEEEGVTAMPGRVRAARTTPNFSTSAVTSPFLKAICTWHRHKRQWNRCCA